MRKTFLILILLFLFASAAPAHAGFGITPPYVRNASLTRSSRYQQKILLVRSDPLEDLQGDITVNLKNAASWITIDKGTSFMLPKGETRVPIVVTVAVPKNAPFGQYKGNLLIKVSPPGGPDKGTVGIALGAQVDVDFTVIDKEIIDFKIRKISVSDLNEGHKFLWMYFPGKIKFTMQVENTGNVPSSPSKVAFDITDSNGKILESEKNTNSLTKVEPFETKDVIAELPFKLQKGSYNATYRVYKPGTQDDLISQEGQISLTVYKYGTLKEGGYGIGGLPLRDKIILIAILLVLLTGTWITIRKARASRSLLDAPRPGRG